jgi:hypothetical protein
MNPIQQIENLSFSRVMRQRWKFGKICFAIIVQSILFVLICQLLLRAKLGHFADLIFLSEAITVLIVSPYLACSAFNKLFGRVSSDDLLLLSPIRFRSILGRIILGSQIYSLCFIGLATLVFIILIPPISEISRFNVVLLHAVFCIYTFVGASVGALGWQIFRSELFATEMVYFVWLILIGGVFLLSPLDRYLENLQPIIPPFLHINPLIAVCHLLEIDIFRTPYLYLKHELTPIPSYDVKFPLWYIVCGWQALIGLGCFLLASKVKCET